MTIKKEERPGVVTRCIEKYHLSYRFNNRWDVYNGIFTS